MVPRRLLLQVQLDRRNVSSSGQSLDNRNSPYGGLPHRSFSNRSVPLYLNTVARPKSEILRLPV